MAPRFSEVTNPLDAAARSEAAAFLMSFNASRWADDLQSTLNLTHNTTGGLRRVGRALHTTITSPQIGHYILLGALLLLLIRELLVRFSVKRALKRTHVD